MLYSAFLCTNELMRNQFSFKEKISTIFTCYIFLCRTFSFLCGGSFCFVQIKKRSFFCFNDSSNLCYVRVFHIVTIWKSGFSFRSLSFILSSGTHLSCRLLKWWNSFTQSKLLYFWMCPSYWFISSQTIRDKNRKFSACLNEFSCTSWLFNEHKLHLLSTTN